MADLYLPFYHDMEYEMEKKKVGKLVNTQGLKGDMRIYPSITNATMFEDFEFLYIEGEGSKEFVIEKIRYKKNLVICKFVGYDHIDVTECFREKDVYIPLEADYLDEGEIYIADLVGCVINDKEQGDVGVVIDVLNYKAHDILVVKSKTGSEYMIPYVDAFIKDVDSEKKIIEAELIEGMVE